MNDHEDDETYALLERAEEALDQGDIDRALDLLEEPAQLPDAHPDVRAMFGLALYYSGDYEEAYELVLDAVAQDPEDVEARGALGVCHFYRLEMVTAEKELRRALLSEPEWSEAHWWLGRVLEFRGRYPEAMIEFQRASALDREHYPVPMRLSDDELDKVANEAIEGLPPRIKSTLDEVAILVEEYPTEELLRESEPALPPDLLGLFTGTALVDRSTLQSGAPANTIHIFKRNLELFGGTREEVVDELRITLLHEIGHWLGMNEEELEALGLE
ncbi:MAG: metallopeptidase family protein [Candidatus Eiseniibacteriota bacterium]